MRRTYLLIGWSVIIVLLSWQLWHYGKYVSATVIEEVDLEATAVVNVAFLAGLVALGLAVFQDKKFALISAAIISLSFLIFFGITPLNLLGVLLVFLLHYIAIANVKRDMARTELDLFHTLRVGTFRVVLGIFFLISFAAYQAPNIQNFKDASSLPSGFSLYFEKAAEYTAGDQIPAGDREKEIAKKQIGQEAFRRMNLFIQPYFQYAPPIVSFALFIILLGLSWIFVWAGAGIALGVFWVLRQVKLVKVEKMETEAEVVRI